MEYIRVMLIDLPPRIHGLTVYQPGSEEYTILINARLSDRMQCEAYDHEVEHINKRDFQSMLTDDQLEGLRHAV